VFRLHHPSGQVSVVQPCAPRPFSQPGRTRG
jgi:hypothetical protein